MVCLCSVIKILEIDHHIGAAMSGLVADGITLIDNARVNAANHYFNYGEPITVGFLLRLLRTDGKHRPVSL